MKIYYLRLFDKAAGILFATGSQWMGFDTMILFK